MPRAAVSQGKRWCFTLNNWTEQELNVLKELECKYLICGREIGENGTPHLQGFVIFNANKRLNAARRISPRAHWELARGTNEQAAEYCKKELNYVETGSLPRNTAQQAQDQKEVWADFIRSCKEGTSEVEHPGKHVKYNTYVGRTYQPVLEALDSYSGLWYYGEPGCGKSRLARAKYPDIYDKIVNKWWDGYLKEPSVLIDDISLDHKFIGSFLKRWVDHYPYRAEVKNGSKVLRPERLIVTSNYTIREIWGDDPVLCTALERRFTFIDFNKGEQFPAPNFDIMQ